MFKNDICSHTVHNSIFIPLKYKSIYIYHYPGEKGPSQEKQLEDSVVAVFLIVIRNKERKTGRKE